MNLVPIITLITLVVSREFLHPQEHGSYVNPNPRPYERCGAQDLVTLSACCNSVLSKLDDCKADDLACECCALQSIKSDCYSLCPGNPSANFLSVLLADCSSLNEVNACSLPFKKSDDSIITTKTPSNNYFDKMDATLASSVKNHIETEEDSPIDLLFDYDQFVAEEKVLQNQTSQNITSHKIPVTNNTQISESSSGRILYDLSIMLCELGVIHMLI